MSKKGIHFEQIQFICPVVSTTFFPGGTLLSPSGQSTSVHEYSLFCRHNSATQRRRRKTVRDNLIDSLEESSSCFNLLEHFSFWVPSHVSLWISGAFKNYKFSKKIFWLHNCNKAVTLKIMNKKLETRLITLDFLFVNPESQLDYFLCNYNKIIRF